MADIDFNKYLSICYEKYRKSDNQRLGQVMFNTLFEFYPAVADDVLGSDIDPFYDNGKIKPFLEYVERKINEK